MTGKAEGREIRLAASMLCADPGHLERDIETVNRAGVDYMHVDIMDGHFVPNLTGGLDFASCVRQHARAGCDFHLMTEEPWNLVDAIGPRRGERLCIHVENGSDLRDVIKRIRSGGALAGLAMNPGTPVSAVEPYLADLDYLLVLLVNPGFTGQALIGRTLNKLSRLRDLRDKRGLSTRLFVDGAVTLDNILEIVAAGADDLVCGPYTCFNRELGGVGPTLELVKKKLTGGGYRLSHVWKGGAER